MKAEAIKIEVGAISKDEKSTFLVFVLLAFVTIVLP